MLLFRSLPLSLILLIADASPSSATLVSRAIEKVHGVAFRHTKSFARDLRLAFGAVLVTQPDSSSQRVVYCKAGVPSSIGSGGGGSGNSTSMSRSPSPSGTSISSSPKSSATAVPSSPWKLVDSHVSSIYLVWCDVNLIYVR
jgi:hypothetical protein